MRQSSQWAAWLRVAVFCEAFGLAKIRLSASYGGQSVCLQGHWHVAFVPTYVLNSLGITRYFIWHSHFLAPVRLAIHTQARSSAVALPEGGSLPSLSQSEEAIINLSRPYVFILHILTEGHCFDCHQQRE